MCKKPHDVVFAEGVLAATDFDLGVRTAGGRGGRRSYSAAAATQRNELHEGVVARMGLYRGFRILVCANFAIFFGKLLII